MSKWHGGKGSNQRPTNKRRFDENYENIFGKKAPEERVELDEGVHITESDGRQRESKLREHVEGAGIQGQADKEQAVEPTTVVLDGIPTEEDAVKTVLILEWFSEAIGLELSKKWEPSKSYDGYKVVARIILPADKKQAVKFNFCPRCGKRLSGNPDWVHTCTPPEGYERKFSTVTVPENKLTELQIKASQRDELLQALINVLPKLHTGDELPMSYYADKKGVLGDALRAIAKAKGENE
jgi:hypothetical protein